MGHVVSRAGLACDPEKLLAVRTWHTPDSVKEVRQFVGFVGYYRRLIPSLSEPLMVLTVFAWTTEKQGFPLMSSWPTNLGAMLIMQVLLLAAVLLTGREFMFTWLCLVILGRVFAGIWQLSVVW